MEDEIDIYADLPQFNLGDDGENLTETNKKISEKCTQLEKQVTDLTQSLESLQKINKNLEVNLSSLLQTAKAEISRKDKMIAELRSQLDDLQFRRADRSRIAKSRYYSPPKRRERENIPEERSLVQVPKALDTTEFFCSSPPQSNNEDRKSTNKSHQLDGIVNTVFGERLRKRILESQEEERKEREENLKKTVDNRNENALKNPEPQPDSLKLDGEINNAIGLQNKKSNFTPSNNLTNDKPDDRKRLSDDRLDIHDRKRLKYNDYKNRYDTGNDHSDEKGHSHSKNSSRNKSNERHKEISASDDVICNQYRIVDEYCAPVNDNLQTKGEGNGAVSNDDSEDRHNRIAIRLMLLSEGIDPDIDANEMKKVIDEKGQNQKKSEVKNRSKSKSRERDNRNFKSKHHKHRSRSTTPDQYYRSRKRSRQRDNRHRNSRDRFEKRKDMKNKDGDNLSEFSREIYELKDRIEHRVDNRSKSCTRKISNFGKHRRDDDKIYENSRSKTPDSRNSSKERMTRRSRVSKQPKRSKSRENHKNRSTREHYRNADISSQPYNSVVQKIEETKKSEDVPVKEINAETKSLISLEDGEIIDSGDSSPVRSGNHARTLTTKIVSPKLELSDPIALRSKDDTSKSLLPLKDIENSQSNSQPLIPKEPASPVSETNQSEDLTDILNSTKDERIENIAEFIANFTTEKNSNLSDDKTNVNSCNKITQEDVRNTVQSNVFNLEEKISEDKLESALNNLFETPVKNNPPTFPPVENSNAITTKDNHIQDNWCLIAIDSPIKNFEENRKNRMMALNVKVNENLELPNSALLDEPSLKHSKDISDPLCAEKSETKVETEDTKVVSEKSIKSTIQATKNCIVKINPPVIPALRSTYLKGRKKMVLSDTNSEEYKKVLLSRSLYSIAEDKNETDTSKETKIIEKRKERSKSPNFVDKNHNCDIEKNSEKHISKDLCSDSDNVDHSKQNTAIGTKGFESTTNSRCDNDADRKNKKSNKSNNSKTITDSDAKIDDSELLEGEVKESRNKEIGVCKADVLKGTESKNKDGSEIRIEKTDATDELKVEKTSDNTDESVKVTSKAKIEETNGKAKKESQKLIVRTSRRKSVRLRCSNNSLNNEENNSEKTATIKTEALDSIEEDNECTIEKIENQVPINITNDVNNCSLKSDNDEFNKTENTEEKRKS